MHNNNERLCGEITFSLSVSLDNVNETEDNLLEDLKRTFARAISANERFIPKGVSLEEFWIDFVDLYVKDDDDRREDYLMTTNPNI